MFVPSYFIIRTSAFDFVHYFYEKNFVIDKVSALIV